MYIPIDLSTIEAIALASLRMVAFLVIAPPFSYNGIPAQIKGMLAIGLAVAVAPRVAAGYHSADIGMFLVDLLIIICVQHVIHLVAFDHIFERGHGQDDARIDLIRAHNNGAVDLTQSVARLQIIEPQERADFRAVSDDISGIVDRERPHIVRNHDQVLDIFLSQFTEGL